MMLQSVFVTVLILGAFGCQSSPSPEAQSRSQVRRTLDQILEMKTRQEQWEMASQLRSLADSDHPGVEIVTEMVHAMSAAGAGSHLEKEFLRGRYEIIQSAAQISDAELFAGLFPFWVDAPGKSAERYIADWIIRRARLLRVGDEYSRTLSYSVVEEAHETDLLDVSGERRTAALLAATSHNKTAFLNTWVGGFDELPRLLGEPRHQLVVKAGQLETLETAVELMLREEDAQAARALIVELAQQPHWLAKYMAAAAMREDALYDPRAVAIIENEPAPQVVRGAVAAIKRGREARGLPLDQATPPSESRTM